jgi:hypothetical protein
MLVLRAVRGALSHGCRDRQHALPTATRSAAEHGSSVLLLEKAHVRHSGALAMGMDGVNNAVIPGKATPEDYVAEITRANDGIVNQRTIHQTATRGYDMVRRLEGYGVKFEKDDYGEYAVRRVHRSGSYVANPFGGYQVNSDGHRFVDCDYWSGQMMAESRGRSSAARCT